MTETTERHGRGLLECPMPDHECDVTIIGSYGDLLTHARGHDALRWVSMDGVPVLDRIKEAQKDALQKDIQAHMVVGTKQNQPTEGACHEANGGEQDG